jgi:hypothetical protein
MDSKSPFFVIDVGVLHHVKFIVIGFTFWEKSPILRPDYWMIRFHRVHVDGIRTCRYEQISFQC